MTSLEGLIVTLPSPFPVPSSFWKTPFPCWVQKQRRRLLPEHLFREPARRGGKQALGRRGLCGPEPAALRKRTLQSLAGAAGRASCTCDRARERASLAPSPRPTWACGSEPRPGSASAGGVARPLILNQFPWRSGEKGPFPTSLEPSACQAGWPGQAAPWAFTGGGAGLDRLAQPAHRVTLSQALRFKLKLRSSSFTRDKCNPSAGALNAQPEPAQRCERTPTHRVGGRVRTGP